MQQFKRQKDSEWPQEPGDDEVLLEQAEQENWGLDRYQLNQLTVQRNWNLHPKNYTPDMTGLKDTYRSGENNHLGNTVKVRMEINVVRAPVMNTLVIYASTSHVLTW